MRIGILGCGYVGQAMAAEWKKEGHQVTVTTRQPEKVAFLQTLADHVALLKDSDSLRSFMDQQDALLICVAPGAASDYRSTYLHTAQQVAQQTHQQSSLQHILYTSSTSVYGDHAGAWVDENTPLTLTHDNAKILAETEQTLLDCTTQNLKVCVLRLGEIYGPNRRIEDRLRRMQQQPFAGTGDSYTNLIHLTDIVNALHFALKNSLQGIYNLCSDFHMPRKDFYDEICQKERLSPIQWNPQLAQAHGGNKRISNQKIKKEGFAFTYPQYFPSSEF